MWLCSSNYSKHHNFSAEADTRSADLEIPRLVWTPEVHYRVHNSSQLYTMLSRFNLVHPSYPISLSSILVLYNVRGTRQLLTTSCTVFRYLTPFWLLIRFITIPNTRNYNNSQLFLTLCHIYTAYNLTRSQSLLYSSYSLPTLYIFTLPVSVSYRDLTCRTTT
jgi:hypothetical protein